MVGRAIGVTATLGTDAYGSAARLEGMRIARSAQSGHSWPGSSSTSTDGRASVQGHGRCQLSRLPTRRALLRAGPRHSARGCRLSCGTGCSADYQQDGSGQVRWGLPMVLGAPSHRQPIWTASRHELPCEVQVSAAASSITTRRAAFESLDHRRCSSPDPERISPRWTSALSSAWRRFANPGALHGPGTLGLHLPVIAYRPD